MAQVRVSIVDPQNSKITQVEIPDGVAAQRLTTALVTRMGLPREDESGQPISYRLGYSRNGVDAEVLSDQTLAQAGIQNDETLRLYANMQSGKAASNLSHETATPLRLTGADRQMLVEEIIDAFEARTLVKIIHQIGTTRQEREKTHGTILVKPIFGLPHEDGQYQCDAFMIMPFSPEFQSIYQDYIKPVIESYSLRISRGDDFFTNRSIIEDLWSALARARFIIADCTGRNANVFYELGIAHALGKPTILLAQTLNDLPFDIQGRRAIVYEDRAGGLKLLQDRVREAVAALLAAEQV